MYLLDMYKKYKACYKNPLTTLYKIYKGYEFIPLTLKDNYSVTWPRTYVYEYPLVMSLFPQKAEQLMELFKSITNQGNIDGGEEFIDVDYKGQSKFYGAIHNGNIVNGDIIGVFFKEDYSFLEPEGATIIDIGANIGDTAIYFALNNAKEIIALEPYLYSYKYALKNIKTNNLNKKIILLNAGYGKDSEIIVDQSQTTSGLSLLNGSNKGSRINLYSLKTLINSYNKYDNLLLKMDCEGCEYNLLNEDNNTLRKFRRIQIEYHYGYKNLESKLKEAGFEVTHSRPSKSNSDDEILKRMALANHDFTSGFIYAKREE